MQYNPVVTTPFSADYAAQLMVLPRRYEPHGRLNVVCPYFTMFPLDFPYKVLEGAKKSDWVLDPFCGRGTTLFASRLHGLGAVGIDSNPVAAAIAAAKFAHVRPKAVTEFCSDIFRNPPSSIEVPDGDFWRACYHYSTLLEICILREFFIRNQGCHLSDLAKVLRAIVLGILHGPLVKGPPTYLSNQMPRTYATKPNAALAYWAKRNMRPPRVNTLQAVQRRTDYLLQQLPPKTPGRVVHGDIRNISMQWSRQFSYVITSPPYLGMRCYLLDQWLRNWFLGLSEDVEYDESLQLGVENPKTFTEQLARVWRRIASVCRRGATLAVRFGALPSLRQNSSLLLKQSLASSAAPWRITKVRSVSAPPVCRRQASQFQDNATSALNEVDVYARLEG